MWSSASLQRGAKRLGPLLADITRGVGEAARSAISRHRAGGPVGEAAGSAISRHRAGGPVDWLIAIA